MTVIRFSLTPAEIQAVRWAVEFARSVADRARREGRGDAGSLQIASGAELAACLREGVLDEEDIRTVTGAVRAALQLHGPALTDIRDLLQPPSGEVLMEILHKLNAGAGHPGPPL